jgi:hypothetical protein
MKSLALSVLAFCIAGLLSTPAEAWHRHHRHHFYPRVIFYGPLYYPPPYYYPPYQPQPVYYIEQPRPQPAAQPGVPAQLHSGSYWYCQAVGAYYPSVPSCVAGWTKVPAVPPSERSR